MLDKRIMRYMQWSLSIVIATICSYFCFHYAKVLIHSLVVFSDVVASHACERVFCVFLRTHHIRGLRHALFLHAFRCRGTRVVRDKVYLTSILYTVRISGS